VAGGETGCEWDLTTRLGWIFCPWHDSVLWEYSKNNHVIEKYKKTVIDRVVAERAVELAGRIE
jgi:hypothetical protein